MANHPKHFAILFTFVSLVCAREVSAIMSYGFHVGTNFANARVKSSGGTDARVKIGLAGGAGIDLFLGGPLFLQMEATYMQRGFRVPSGTNILSATDTAFVDYVEFPFLLRGQPPGYNPNRFSFLAGPVYAFRVRSTIPNTQQHVFHFLIGAGFECDVDKTTAFFVSARYNFGLSNALFGTSDSLKHDGIQLLLGLRFETLGNVFFKPKTERFERFKKLKTKGADY